MSQTLEDVYHSIVKVTGNGIVGTGFSIMKGYCATSHHVISNMDKIRIEYNNKISDAEWIEELSDMKQDIAILKIKNRDVKPLQISTGIMKGLEICGFGYNTDSLDSHPSGESYEGKIGNLLTPVTKDEEKPNFNNKWNKSPKVRFQGYQIISNLAAEGFSGGPVCYKEDPHVIGMYVGFHKESSPITGYVMPMEIIMDKFRKYYLSVDPKKIVSKSILDKIRSEIQDEHPSYVRNFSTLIGKAEKYLDCNRCSDALNIYEKLLDYPIFAKVWLKKGITSRCLNKHQEAITCFDKALKIDNKDVEIYYHKGMSLFELNKTEKAIDCFDKALKIDENYADTWYQKGLCYTKLEQHEKAQKCYSNAVQIDQRHTEAWSKKALSLTMMNQYDEVVNCYDQMLKLDRNNKIIHYNKGLALAKMNRHKEAVSSFTRCLRIDKEDVRSNYHKGISLLGLNKHKHALACFNEVTKKDPNYAEAWYHKGISCG
ncbi:MAG: tetratricopeptide repeat protein, partial [Flavobacteriales bacterium]|nr:tetratricopeptide repeat protein [Flavobacteriales bacterium]